MFCFQLRFTQGAEVNTERMVQLEMEIVEMRAKQVVMAMQVRLFYVILIKDCLCAKGFLFYVLVTVWKKYSVLGWFFCCWRLWKEVLFVSLQAIVL